MGMESNCIWKDFCDAKNDYIHIFFCDVRDPINQYFQSLYDKCVDDQNRINPHENHQYTLKQFQIELSELSENMTNNTLEIIKQEIQKTASFYTFKEEIAHAIFLMQFRMMVVTPNNNGKTTDVVLPTFDKILKQVIMGLAMEFKRHVYYFIDNQINPNMNKITVQENINKRREIIKQVIHEVILKMMPMKQILSLIKEDLTGENNIDNSKTNLQQA